MSDRLCFPNIDNTRRYTLMPNINTGGATYSRIGEEIEPIRFTVKMTLSLVTPTRIIDSFIGPEFGNLNSGPEDITAHVYIFFSKQYPDYSDRGDLGWSMNQFLKRSRESDTGYEFDGTHDRGKFIMNPNIFKAVHHFRVRLKKGSGYQSYSRMVTNNNPDPEYAPEQHAEAFTGASQFADLTFSIPFPKKLRYASQASTQPENYCPYVVVGWTPNEYPLEVPPMNTLLPLAATCTSHFWYKDM